MHDITYMEGSVPWPCCGREPEDDIMTEQLQQISYNFLDVTLRSLPITHSERNLASI